MPCPTERYAAAWRQQVNRHAASLLDSVDARYLYRGDCLDLLAMAHARRTLDHSSCLAEALPVYQPFLARLRDSVATFDAARALTALGFPATVTWGEPEPDEIARRALQLMPHVIIEVTLIRRIGVALPDVLTGKMSFMDAVSPAADTSMLEALYFGSTSAILHNITVAAAFEAIATVNKPLRILEIGAGTGGTTASISHLIDRSCTEYWFTDVSNVFLGVARRRFKSPAFRYELLNVEDTAAFEALAGRQRFDLVIAANAIHNASSLTRALHNVNLVLADEGCLLLSETDLIPRWTEFIFSAAPDWWNARDSVNRSLGPLASPDQWRALLRETIGSSFATITPEFLPTLDADYLRQFPQVIIATKSARAPSVGSGIVTANDREIGAVPATKEDQVVSMVEPPAPHQRVAVTTRIDAKGRCRTLANKLDATAQLEIGTAPGVATAFLAQHAGVVFEFCLLLEHGELNERLLIEPECRLEAEGLLEQWFGVLCFAREVLSAEGTHRLSVISLGGQQIGRGEVNVALSGYQGLFSAAAVEYPQAPLRTFDADPTLGGRALVASLHRFLDRPFAREELAERAGVLVTPVLTRSSLIRPKPQLPSIALESLDAPQRSQTADYVIRIGRPGDFDDLDLLTVERRTLAPHEVEVEVHHAALNYRDVLKVQGEYPFDGGDYMDIGDEAAGIVAAVGANVAPDLVGRRVMVLGSSLLTSRAIVDARQVIAIPDSIGMADAATMPVAYLTAHYALVTVGRLRAGQKVLIHAAAGGVGLAAIRVAKWIGAEVYATASLPKQASVRLWGADHVFDSRGLDFEAGVLAASGGKGVDVLLNSLSGQHQAASLRVLAEFGRFVEIGKRDLYEHTELDQYELRRNASFHVVDMSKLPQADEVSWNALREEVTCQVNCGAYSPLPHRTYRAAHIGHALRTMATGRHIGKILIAARDPSIEPLPARRRRVRDHREMAVAVTGGLSGFGLAVARAYMMAGIGHLVIASRTDPFSERVASTIADLKQSGRGQITFFQGDIAEPGAADRLVQATHQFAPGRPLTIIHAAGVYHDEPIERISREHFLEVCRPKVLGALGLHHATRRTRLDTLCFVSSVSSLLGNAGQASYGMANAFLDQLALARREAGRPASSVNLGPLSEVGFLADKPKVRAIINRMGTNFVPTQIAVKALENVTVMGLVRVGVFDMDWRVWRDQMRFSEVPTKLAQVVSAQAGNETTANRIDIRQILERADPGEWLALMEDYVRGVVASILTVEPATVDPTANLASHGLDSLSSVEMGLTIERGLGLSLQVEDVGDIRSVRAVAKYLVNRYRSMREAA
jgi:NADPH:quinone reductase-like Zn-dependent oxidoreductase/NAD(P)-dependent dehydrogenase (short-subunit alcohol dehydrogenase family)/acyl carrier protein/SAM-dependent methyltransferase